VSLCFFFSAVSSKTFENSQDFVQKNKFNTGHNPVAVFQVDQVLIKKETEKALATEL
jgi:hypothetical protein